MPLITYDCDYYWWNMGATLTAMIAVGSNNHHDGAPDFIGTLVLNMTHTGAYSEPNGGYGACLYDCDEFWRSSHPIGMYNMSGGMFYGVVYNSMLGAFAFGGDVEPNTARHITGTCLI